MKLISCFKNKVKDLWEPNFRGIFAFYQEAVHFHFLYNDSVYALNCSDGMIHKINTSPAQKIELPSWWICSFFCERPFLMCGKDVCVDLTQKFLVTTIPECLKKEFLHKYCNYQLLPEKKIDVQPYEFEDHAIYSQGAWGYLCKRNGKEVWTFKGRASLATDIYCRNGSVYWGTSGSGGYFYILDLKSGVPKLSLQTGGTHSFCQNGDFCYIGRRQKNKSSVACISLSSASIIDEFVLEGMFTDNSQMYMQEGKLYIVTFSRQMQDERELIVTTIDCSL